MEKGEQGKAGLVSRPGAFPCWASDTRGPALVSIPCCFLPAGGAGRGRAGSFGGGKSVWGRGVVGAGTGPHATHVSTGS